MTSDELVILRNKPRAQRLRLAAQLAGKSYGWIAARSGVSRAHVASAAQGRQSLSLPTKVRVARALAVPASVLWPELETLALELLHGFAGRAR